MLLDMPCRGAKALVPTGNGPPVPPYGPPLPLHSKVSEQAGRASTSVAKVLPAAMHRVVTVVRGVERV